MDTRPLAALFRQLESTTVDVAEICFSDKGEVTRVSLHPKRTEEAKAQPKQEPKKDEEKPKKKVTAIDSLKLGDRHWVSGG